MVLYHIVLFKLRPNITAEESARFVAGAENLKQIPGVLSTQCGEISKTLYPNYNDRTKGFTHSLLIVLKDAEALEVYDKSPFHEQLKQSCFLPLVDKMAENPYMAFDYFGKLPEDRVVEPKRPTSLYSKPWFVALTVAAGVALGFMGYRSRL